MELNEFLEAAASKNPVPGGGGVSAYVAALGMSLGSMVANLTAGKKKYAEYEEEIQAILQETPVLTAELASYIQKDAEAFEPLSRAYGLPKNTEEEAAARDEIMAKCLADAATAPLCLMEKIMEALSVLSRLSVIGSRIAISDVGVGAQLCKAALNSASLNVYINTKLMKNRELAQELNHKTRKLAEEGSTLADAVYDKVLGEIVN